MERIDRGESYRQIAQSYTDHGRPISYQSIYRIVRALRQQQGGEA